MSKQEQDTTYFVAWCIEQYKVHKGIDGESSMTLLDKYGVLEYLSDAYEVLHTQNRQWLMEEIDEMIEERRNKATL